MNRRSIWFLRYDVGISSSSHTVRTCNPLPPGDEYDSQLAFVVQSVVTSGLEAARANVQDIVVPYGASHKRPAIPPALYARVLRRDCFTCRYCNAQTIPTPIMRAISFLFPVEFRYHKNWKAGATHPAVASRSSTVDHVEPNAHGGDNNLENLVTACWPCNVRKGELTLDRLGWKVHQVADTEWVGLTDLYPRLWELVENAADPRPSESERSSHRRWLAAFGQGAEG